MLSITTCSVIGAGLLIGVLLGLTGGGGSILTVPLLVYLVGLDPKIAIATSLFVVGIASLAAVGSHARSGNVHWRTGAMFGLAGMVGAYTGGRVAQYISEILLLLLFAGVMLGSGSAMLRRRNRELRNAEGPKPSERRWGKVALDGLVVGIVTGLVGAGGGFLVVPALVLLGGLPMHAAVGTSLLVIAMKCFAGLAGYIAHVPIDPVSGVIVSSCAILGTVAGSRLSGRIPAAQLQKGFGIFVLAVAAILIVVEGSALAVAMLDVDRMTAAITLIVIECCALGVALSTQRITADTSPHPSA